MTDILKVVKPQEIYADAGTEFKGAFKKLLDEHGIKFKTEITKYHHGFTGLVDIVVKNITKRLFKRMDAQELRNPKEASTLCVRFLQQEVEYHNNRVKPKIGMSPAKAMKLEKVTLRKPRFARKICSLKMVCIAILSLVRSTAIPRDVKLTM